jgi:alpha-glucosidase
MKRILAFRMVLSAASLFTFATQVFAQATALSPALATDAPLVKVPLGRSGLIGKDIAIFLPQGQDLKSLPPSFSLVQASSIRRALPRGWSLRPEFASNGSRFRASLRVPAEADLYGSGEVMGPLRRNGTAIRLWNTDNYNYGKDGGRRLYQSHPWILGVFPNGSAFGVIFDSTWKSELDCNEAITFTAEGPGFPVIVIERSTPAGVLQALADLTGRMELPPRWALGYQQCRYSYEPDARVRQIADEFRSRRIPCDVIWMDIDYMDGFRIFTFDGQRFPDPRGLNEYLHDKGFKSVWMIDPGVKVDPNYAVYASGRDQDVYVKTAAGGEYHGDVWPGACAFPDFTRPQTRSWWAGLYSDFMAMGVDGVWNDMDEPAVFNTPDWTMPEDNLHRGGGGLAPGLHRQYHNVYGMLMVRATREGILAVHPNLRPFVLTRANFLGGQRYAATWTGDNTSNAKDMRLSVPMSLTLGLSGQPFNGPDIGGFSGDATPNLWARWIGFGAFFPFARGHASKDTNNKEPWAFGEAVERTARIALDRRYRLLPYLYTLFQEASVDGLPIMRPAFMADTKDPALRREERVFLLGSDVLVVPSWAQNAALPVGDWPSVSLVDGDCNDANQATLRIRPGAIVPLGRVVQNTTEESLDPLTLLVCLDARGRAEGRLYEDDGEGFAYRKANYLLTTYQASLKKGRLVVSVASAQGKRPRPPRTVQIQAVGRGDVQTSAVNGL